MSDGARYRDDEEAIGVAIFRYTVIAPVAQRRESLAPGEVSELVCAMTAATHYPPGGGAVRLSERTLWNWLARYREGGIEALRPRVRKDRGSLRALDRKMLERAAELRREAPGRWTSTVLDVMKLEGTLSGQSPHRSTLDRHLRALGASRRQLLVLGGRRTIKMRREHFGALWVGDYHHGPLVLRPDGKPATAKLGAFIDHCTRYPVADRWYLAENIASLRDTLLRALLRWGVFDVAYVDRGAVYRAEQLAYSLGRIDARLVHSREYYSQGRGVIERWWQLADAFEVEVRQRPELLTLHDLNLYWEAFRTRRYLEQVHSELGRTPNEAIADVVPRPLDPEVARELFLVRADRVVHKHDACVSVEGTRFLCESFLRGRKVQVRFDPCDLSHVVVFADNKRVGRALPQPINAPAEPHPPRTAPPPVTKKSSVDYLALIRTDFDRRLIEHARPLAYSELRIDPGFDRDAFVAAVLSLAGLGGRDPEREELSLFWDALGPLPETLVRVATEHAVRLHGRGRHVRIYLHAIRTLVIAHLKSPARKEDP